MDSQFLCLLVLIIHGLGLGDKEIENQPRLKPVTSTLMWVTEKELETEIKNIGDKFR